jgi:hypothetical protein
VVRPLRVPLGKFACDGIEACLETDVAAGVRAALSHFTHLLESGPRPVDLPRAPLGGDVAEPAVAVELSLDERSWELLRREAGRQGATVSQLAVHSVMVYLAELDRLAPDPGSAAA